jgi:hypothetical protein
MTHPPSDFIQDVMQVCLNGHVITDLTGAHPERRRSACDRCGAATIDRCPTCGTDLPGAIAVPGLAPIGTRRPPRCCSVCGAALPWARQSPRAAADPTAPLEQLLRRLPRAIRQLRWRQGDRPPFRVEDERDLEDLLRALLPLHFDDVRPESRTPRYAAGVRTDFRLAPERIVVAVKVARPPILGDQLTTQLKEDADCYRGRPDCRTLIALVYDPEGRIPEPRSQEAAWSVRDGEWELRCVISTAEAAHSAQLPV